MKLYQPHGGNRFCGPTTLSALTGKSTDECALLASRNGKPLKMMYHDQMITSLRKAGIRFQPIKSALVPLKFLKPDKNCYPTLMTWMKEVRKPSEMGKVYIVNITDHYILVLGDKVCDTYTHGVWTDISKYPRRSSHVRAFIKILDDVSESEMAPC